MYNDARVLLWGSVIGAVTWLEDREVGVFQYAPDFLESGIQLAPLMMPLGEFPYEFPALARNLYACHHTLDGHLRTFFAPPYIYPYSVLFCSHHI